VSRPPEKIAESHTEINYLGTLLLLWIGKSAEDHFCGSMLIIGFLKTYFHWDFLKGGLMLQIYSILNNLQIFIISTLPKCISLSVKVGSSW